MYIPLFQIRYQHEFFDGAPLFDMDCTWPSEVEKLIRNMGLSVVPRSGEIQVMFDSTAMERENGVHGRIGISEAQKDLLLNRFLEVWSEDVLTFYLSPKDKALFHNITGGLGALVSDRESLDSNGNVVTLPRCFRFFNFNSSQPLSNSGIDLPSTILDQVSRISEISEHMRSTEKSRISVAPSLDLKLLKKMVKQNTMFVLCVELKELKHAFDNEDKNPLVNLKFNAEKTHYKYYFTAIPPDKDLQIICEGKNEPTDVTYSQVSEQHSNQSVCTFISNQPIGLRWRHDKYFKLVRNVVGSPQTIFSKLPHPSPTNYYKHTFPNRPPIKVLEAFIN